MTGIPGQALAATQSESGATLLDEVESFIGRYVAFPNNETLTTVTLWAAHTHALDSFDSTPRLALLSPEPGSGKTRALEVLDALTPNPLHSLSASPAAVFRLIDADRPTLLCDEVDNLFGRSGRDDDNADLRALLNAGHRRGATIPRCVGPTHGVQRFTVFAAAALAGLGDLPDTLMSRSVVVRMRRRAPDEQVRPWRQRTDPPIGYEFRDRLAVWTESNADALRLEPVMPEGVTDRPADVWEPLLAVADAAGGHWPDRARAACVDLTRPSVSRGASLGIRLLADLHAIFDGDLMATSTILDCLRGLDESPWESLRGKPLDPRGLARILGGYGIESRNVRIGSSVLRGYRRDDLFDTWQRYLPPAEALHPLHPQHTRSEPVNPVADAEGVADVSATGLTSATESEPSTRDVADVADVADLRERETVDLILDTFEGSTVEASPAPPRPEVEP